VEQERLHQAFIAGNPKAAAAALIKLSDLSRILGRVRCRLYYDAGFDTLNTIAECDPEEFRVMIKDHINRAGVDYIHPPQRKPSMLLKPRSIDL
jgi:hypothetical protein